MGVVLVFIFCQSFTLVADLYEFTCVFGDSEICKSNPHIERFIDLAHLVLAFNSSTNFILYMVHIKGFREAFLKVFEYEKSSRVTDLVSINGLLQFLIKILNTGDMSVAS